MKVKIKIWFLALKSLNKRLKTNMLVTTILAIIASPLSLIISIRFKTLTGVILSMLIAIFTTFDIILLVSSVKREISYIKGNIEDDLQIGLISPEIEKQYKEIMNYAGQIQTK